MKIDELIDKLVDIRSDHGAEVDVEYYNEQYTACFALSDVEWASDRKTALIIPA